MASVLAFTGCQEIGAMRSCGRALAGPRLREELELECST